jgi:hypothetical protein
LLTIVPTTSRAKKLKTGLEPKGLAHKVFYHDTNQGKGAAVRTSIREASPPNMFTNLNLTDTESA